MYRAISSGLSRKLFHTFSMAIFTPSFSQSGSTFLISACDRL